jgi:hypothetical protein
MFFNIYIGIVSVAVILGCIVAIIMSTSHGTRWIQSLWTGQDDGRKGDDRDAA